MCFLRSRLRRLRVLFTSVHGFIFAIEQSTIEHSSMEANGLSKTKRSLFRRMRNRNVSSTHPAGETTIVNTLLFLVACANYSAVGRKMEKRDSALTSQLGFCGISRYPLEMKVKDNCERRIFDFLSKAFTFPVDQQRICVFL